MIRNKARLFGLTIWISIVLEVEASASAIKQWKEIRSIKIRKEAIKMIIFADDLTIHNKILKSLQKDY